MINVSNGKAIKNINQVKLMLLASCIDNRIEPRPQSNHDLQSNNPFAIEILKTGEKLQIK